MSFLKWLIVFLTELLYFLVITLLIKYFSGSLQTSLDEGHPILPGNSSGMFDIRAFGIPALTAFSLYFGWIALSFATRGKGEFKYRDMFNIFVCFIFSFFKVILPSL